MNHGLMRRIVAVAMVGCVLVAAPARATDEDDLFAAFKEARALDAAAKYAEAVAQYETALKLALKVFGEDHENTAAILNNMAEALRVQGKLAAAEPLYKRSLAVREKLLGKDHPKVGTALNSLAYLYQDSGEYAAAGALIERSLAIREKALGKDHPDVAISLNSLAEIRRIEGKYVQAEPLYQRSLRILEAAKGKDHPNVASVLNNLALLYRSQGKYAQSEPLQLRALAIEEAVYGKDHPAVANSLNNLAIVYVDQEKYDRAEPLHLRCLKIREAAFGPDHPAVAASLNNLGILLSVRGQWAKAVPLFERGLTIYETALGKDHPDLADVLNNLAAAHRDLGEPARAVPLYQRSLALAEAVYGKDHPAAARALLNLGVALVDQENFADAVAVQTRLRRSARSFLLRELPSLSVREQQDFLDQIETQRFAFALSLGRHLGGKDQAVAKRSAEWLLNGKAIGLEAQALDTVLERQADPALVRQLNDLRAREAALALRITSPEQRDDLQAQRRELEKRIAQTGGAAANLARPWIDLEEVRRAIPADGLLVEIARFKPVRFGAKAGEKFWDEPRYVAWLIPPTGDVTIVDLGGADAIEAAVKRVRTALADAPKRLREVGEVKAAAEVSEPLAALADLVLKPLAPHLGKAKSLILSPDGELWLAPWAALPVGKDRFLIEDFALRHVLTGRDLVAVPLGKALPTTAPLVLADPDFDGGSGKAGPGAESGERSFSAKLPKVLRLPGTASEAEAVVPNVQKVTGSEPVIHTDGNATEAVVKAARRPRMLILATHGFFLPTREVPNNDRVRLSGDGKRAGPTPAGDGQRVENPLLRCGLLLSGCNNRAETKAGDDDGVLTGLEIVGTDLRGTEMVVLSACETGLGEVRNGQGVAGLRQAFQLAGAGSVVATLWQIPDVQSAQLMAGFFDHLAKGQQRAEALQSTQKDLIQKRRDRFGAAHPFFWAAYTVTGQVR